MVTFDSPEFEKMVEQDNLFLANGKINWESKLISTVEQLIKCYTNLSRYEDYSDDFFDAHENSSYMYQTDSQISEELGKLEHSLNEDIQESRKQVIAIKIWNLKNLMKVRKSLSELTKNIAHTQHNNAVEALANEIKDWKKQDKQFSWKDVALSMLRFPERITFDYNRCPDCGHSRIRIYFYSPKCTWAMMCGVGGDMIICPGCKIQAEFNETIRN